MAIYLVNFDARISRIEKLTAEANRLTSLVREANSQTRASLLRSRFTLVVDRED